MPNEEIQTQPSQDPDPGYIHNDFMVGYIYGESPDIEVTGKLPGDEY